MLPPNVLEHGIEMKLRFAFTLILAFAIFTLTSCSGDKQKTGEASMPKQTIQQVLDQHTGEWMALPGVVGTGIGERDGKPCIKVFVAKKTAELEKKIPSQVDGYPVVIEETGEFKALGTD